MSKQLHRESLFDTPNAVCIIFENQTIGSSYRLLEVNVRFGLGYEKTAERDYILKCNPE